VGGKFLFESRTHDVIADLEFFRSTAGPVLELQRPSDHRSGRDRLNACCSVRSSSQALLREILHFPRHHLDHERLLAQRKQAREQTREWVWLGKLEEERGQHSKRAQRDCGEAQSCGYERAARHPQVEHFSYCNCKRGRSQYREWSLGRAAGLLGQHQCSSEVATARLRVYNMSVQAHSRAQKPEESGADHVPVQNHYSIQAGRCSSIAVSKGFSRISEGA